MPNMDDRRWALEQALRTMDQHRNLIDSVSFNDVVDIAITTASKYSDGLDNNYSAGAPKQ